MIDQAIILAAGLGTRMRPLTDTLPKALVSVGGRALIDRALDCLISAGISRVVVNIHHHADLLESHLLLRDDIDIYISDERSELLDSGGGIKRGLEFLSADEFIVLNADSFWHDSSYSNLRHLLSTWDSGCMDMNLLLSPLSSSVGYSGVGDFHRHCDGHLERCSESSYIYSGAMVARSDIFTCVSSSIFGLNSLFDSAISGGRLYGEVLRGIWFHVGTPDAVDLVQRRLEDLSNV